MISPRGRNLAFLVGAPRSGTTLVSLVLSKSPEVYCPPEPWLALPLTRLSREAGPWFRDDSERSLARRAAVGLLGEQALRDQESRLLVATYNQLLRRKPGARLFVDKTPRYYKILDDLGLRFGNARFVLMGRNPLDVAASWKSRWGADLARLVEPGRVGEASFDVFCAPALLERARLQLGRRALFLRYEDLALDPERAVEDICRHVGIPWDASLLEYRVGNPGAEEHRHSELGDDQVFSRDGIDGRSIGRWREVLSPDECALVANGIGAALLERLGYEGPAAVAEPDAAGRFVWDAFEAHRSGAPEVDGDAGLAEQSQRLTARVAEGERAKAFLEDARRELQGERSLREREASEKQRWRKLFRQAEGQREAERLLREREAAEKQRWRDLFGEAEGQREAERSLREREAAEKQRWRDLFGEAEGQREAERSLREREAAEKQHWRKLFGEAESQRDAERLLREREAGEKEHWRELFRAVEQQRNGIQAGLDRVKLDLERSEALRIRSEERLEAVRVLWPWMEATEGRDPEAWPRISIVTPSFNQARFIEATIRSVLDQNYPNFEHIVVDGGSSDRTRELVQAYPHVRFVSEPDLGQAHAINKGLMLASGDILAYLNSDDLYRPGAFQAVASALADPRKAQVVVGACDTIDEDGNPVGHLAARLDRTWDLLRYWGWGRWYCIPQQSVFWRREVLSEVGLFDVGLHYVLDYDMWLRMAASHRFAVLDQTLSAFRLQPESKTLSSTWRMYLEERAASRRYWPSAWRPSRGYLELASLRHLARKLLDVAEHEVLANRRRRHPIRLLSMAAVRWPPLLLAPRFWLTAQSAVLLRSPLGRGAEWLHRRSLGLLWRLRRLSSRADQVVEDSEVAGD